MTDANDKPVSMRKRGVPTPATTVPRPSSVVALVAALIVSGLAGILAGLALYGQHSYLVSSVKKNQPVHKLTTPVISTLTTSTTDALVGALTPHVGSKLTSAQITSIADTTSAAFKSTAHGSNFGKDQLSNEVTKVSSEVKDELGAISTSLTTNDVSARRTDFSKALKADLQSVAKDQLDAKQIDDQASKIPTSQVIAGVVLMIALSFVAFGAYAGRYWGRWAVPVIWVLSSFTGAPAGIIFLLQLGSDEPIGFKLASGVSAASLVVAVVLSFIRPTKLWWAAHRPEPVAGAPARRGLFAPRTAPAPRGATARATGGRTKPGSAERDTAAAGRAASTRPAAERNNGARTKKRVAAEATRNGADLARSRAKTASKSRRTES